ncbi:MAG: PUR family DNA/RNA-binding protein [Chloroflexi bacterium]|nr:PUR family DNA/RNA-binding protein [Chloroflexota bacterium]
MKASSKEGISLKAGATTYFFDIRETKQGSPYLSVTESRGKGENQGFKRTTINVFPDQVEEFAKIIYRVSGEVLRRSKAANRGVSK